MQARSLIDECGLRFEAAFLRDPQFWQALAAAPLALALLQALHPDWATGARHDFPSTPAATVWFLLWALAWQPFVEELLFRGIIQGRLARWGWNRVRIVAIEIDAANLATSLLFALTHLVHSPPLWAAAVFLPSLVFGHFRQRHGSIHPCIVLHGAYNGVFLCAVALQG